MRQLQVIVDDANFFGELVSVTVTMLVVTAGTTGATANVTDNMPPAVGTGEGVSVGSPAGSGGFTATDELYGGVPPTITNWKVFPAHPVADATVGLIARSDGGETVGEVCATSLVSSGPDAPGMVRPVASVMAYCMFTKQAPVVVAVKPPPLVATVLVERVTTPGNVSLTVYGGVPPKM